MSPRRLPLILASLLSSPVFADNCTTLIQYGLRDEIQSMANANNYQESVNQLCQDYSSFKEDKKSGNLKASYGAFKGSAGFSAERYEAVSEALCASSTNMSSLKSETSLTNRLLNPAALDALKHCESLNAAGLRVTTDIPDAAETITISFYLAPLPGTSVVQEIKVGKPRTDSGISCDEPSPQIVDGKLPAFTTVTYTCSRKIADAPFSYLGKRLYAKEGSITIPTSNAPITRRVPAVYAEQAAPTDTELKLRELGEQGTPVGSILASVLSPTEIGKAMPAFQKYWALADGAVVDRSSAYFRVKTDGSLNNVRLPDLRGLFLRGLNVGRADGKQDPDGAKREAADFQADALQKHKHTITRGTMGGNRAWLGGWFWASADGDSGAKTGSTDDQSYPADGDGGAVRVGSETRPKNAAVYYYVRIN